MTEFRVVFYVFIVCIFKKIIADMIAKKAAKRRRRCDDGFVISTLTSPTRFTKERIMVLPQ